MKYSKLFGEKIILKLIVSVILINILSLYMQWSGAMKLVDKGDVHLNNKEFSQAIQRYQEAQQKWPLLQNDKYVNKQLDTVYIFASKAIVIFLNVNATQSDIDSLIFESKQISGVKKVYFVSKEKAFEIYQEKYKDDPELMELVTPEILPASIEISIEDISAREKVIQLVNSKNFVEDVIK